MQGLPDKKLIRSVHQDDLPAIGAIERICFPVPWKESFFASELGQEFRYQRVLLLDDVIAGYLFTYYVIPDLHISKLAVPPGFQRRGLGNLLMNEMVSFCLQEKIETVTLEVRVSNTPALNFYRRWGFSVFRRRKKYYGDGEDALDMIAPVAAMV